MDYTRAEFEEDWEAYCNGWLHATLEEAQEEYSGIQEAEAEREMERAAARYWENRGSDEIDAEIEHDRQRGVIDFQAYPDNNGIPCR
jgi:hypothetical protein